MKRFVLPSPLLSASPVNFDPQRSYNMPCNVSEPLCTVRTATGSSITTGTAAGSSSIVRRVESFSTVERVGASDSLGVPEVSDNPGKLPSFPSTGFPTDVSKQSNSLC